MAERATFWQRLSDYVFTTSRPNTFRDKTTARVTFSVIILLGAVVLFVAYAAQNYDTPATKVVTEYAEDGKTIDKIVEERSPDDAAANPYIELLSNLSLIIAAGFTTVMGYYFGNRTAENQARDMTAATQQRMDELEKEREELRKEIDALKANQSGAPPPE